jgi:PmbA protein
MTDTISRLDDLIRQAINAGADAADALLVDSASLSVGRRMRKPENLERSELIDFGLRVFIGKRQASVSSTDLKPETLSQLVDKALQMARVVPEDEFAGIAEPEQLAKDWPELDLYDSSEPDPEFLIERASILEEAALAVPGVTNSSGAEASWGRSTITLVASNGFAGQYRRSSNSLSVGVLAGEGDEKQSDHDYSFGAFLADLEDPAVVGKSAGERTVAKMNPRKIDTMRVPIVLDPRVAGGLLGTLAGAISGSSIARGLSFLKDSLGEQILPAGVTIMDDPYLRRGHRSKPFDGEGIAPMQRPIVNDGYLTTWLLDLRSARQLGLLSTGHAARGTGGPPAPSPSNLYLTGGKISRDELLRQVGNGLYVTGLMGQGANMTTGDYSRGATGFWIENGVLTYPVAEVTIAGNMKYMFRNLTPATDLQHRYGIDSPTLRIDGMTIAGH